MTEKNLHSFTLLDAHILLGLADSSAAKGAEISCAEFIASCMAIHHEIPSQPEFAAAFNKFLYIGVIAIAGDKITLSEFGSEIMSKARRNANIRSTELIVLLYKELAGYKLKSMCNRTLWSSEQYQQAINTHRNH